MQVRSVAAREVAARSGSGHGHDERSILDPRTNVRLGAAYLAYLKDVFGDWALALTAYNMGPTRLRAQLAEGRRPAFRYSSAVLARYRELTVARSAPAAAAIAEASAPR
jgi:soluble lytic murein transglycosylase-like protein